MLDEEELLARGQEAEEAGCTELHMSAGPIRRCRSRGTRPSSAACTGPIRGCT